MTESSGNAHNGVNMEFVPTDVLMKEVFKHCDHGALIFMRCGETAPDTHTYYRRWKGNSHTCVRLLDDLQRVILDEMHEHVVGPDVAGE